MTMRSLPARSDIAPEHTWDTASIFQSDADWDAAFERVTAELPTLSEFRGQLGNDAETLIDWFHKVEDLRRSVGKLYVYAGMFYHVDTNDQAAVARMDRVRGLLARSQAAIAFAEPELLALDPATLQRWIREEARLATYQHYFDVLERRRPHVRSAEVEELLAQVRDPFMSASSVHGVLANADLVFEPAIGSDGEPRPVAQSTISSLVTDPDREVRRTAWQNYADAHLAAKNTMANCLATGVKQNVFVARARGYGSALEASLTPNYIPVEVFHNLIATYRQNLPTWHRYWRLRSRALGSNKLQPYDIKAPLTQHNPSVAFNQAVEWICDGMQPLGDEYVAAMRRGLVEQRWVDIYPNQGKRTGAFSTGVQGTHPFIFMSYTDDLFSLSTLAHELGHSMHSYLAWEAQPQIYTSYGLFVAEVASNFNQALVRAHLLDTTTDPEMQIAIIEEAMSNFHRYFFLMPALARFELEIHQRVERGDALTSTQLITLMTDLFREGYGDEVVIDADRIGITWAEFSTHLYSNFYVYQYATGISAAHALANGVLTEGSAAAERYRAFLQAGASVYPLDALKLAGVDMTSPEPVEQTFAVLASYVDRLEMLLNDRQASVG